MRTVYVVDSMSGALESTDGGQTEPEMHIPSTHRRDTVPSQLAAEEGRANSAVEGARGKPKLCRWRERRRVPVNGFGATVQ